MSPAALAALFRRERATFARRFPAASQVTLHLEPKHFVKRPKARDFAWYQPDTHSIHVTQRMLEQSPATILGIVRHELGHAVDARLDDAEAEARADALAMKATGTPIRYLNDVQNASRGQIGRPRYLPR